MIEPETATDFQIKGRKASGGHLSRCEIRQKVTAELKEVQQILVATSSVQEAVRHHSLTDRLKPGWIEQVFY